MARTGARQARNISSSSERFWFRLEHRDGTNGQVQGPYRSKAKAVETMEEALRRDWLQSNEGLVVVRLTDVYGNRLRPRKWVAVYRSGTLDPPLELRPESAT